MFDKNMYVETFSALHASKDTLAEIQEITLQGRKKRKNTVRLAFVLSAVLILMISSVVLAAGGRMMGGRVHHASRKDIEKMGFHYPEQLGEYRLSSKSPTRIHVAPAESSDLLAWLNPDYTWMSLEYKNDTAQSLWIYFGKTDHPLWTYCFNYDDTTGEWIGAKNTAELTAASTEGISYIENVTEYEYRGCTIYLADRITEYSPDKNLFAADQQIEAEAHWTDSEAGLCFSISSSVYQTQSQNSDSVPDKKGMTQKEMLNYVKSVIDKNR